MTWSPSCRAWSARTGCQIFLSRCEESCPLFLACLSSRLKALPWVGSLALGIGLCDGMLALAVVSLKVEARRVVVFCLISDLTKEERLKAMIPLWLFV